KHLRIKYRQLSRKTMTNTCPRNFCWTLNNPTDDEIESMKENVDPLFSYIVWGLEKGKEETPHLQGYAECKGLHRFKKVLKYFNNRGHTEPRGGTPKEAAGYCKKGTDEKREKLRRILPSYS
ncbi:replication protein, partial [uncultured marine virus]